MTQSVSKQQIPAKMSTRPLGASPCPGNCPANILAPISGVLLLRIVPDRNSFQFFLRYDPTVGTLALDALEQAAAEQGPLEAQALPLPGSCLMSTSSMAMGMAGGGAVGVHNPPAPTTAKACSGPRVKATAPPPGRTAHYVLPNPAANPTANPNPTGIMPVPHSKAVPVGSRGRGGDVHHETFVMRIYPRPGCRRSSCCRDLRTRKNGLGRSSCSGGCFLAEAGRFYVVVEVVDLFFLKGGHYFFKSRTLLR